MHDISPPHTRPRGRVTDSRVRLHMRAVCHEPTAELIRGGNGQAGSPPNPISYKMACCTDRSSTVFRTPSAVAREHISVRAKKLNEGCNAGLLAIRLGCYLAPETAITKVSSIPSLNLPRKIIVGSNLRGFFSRFIISANLLPANRVHIAPRIKIKK